MARIKEHLEERVSRSAKASLPKGNGSMIVLNFFKSLWNVFGALQKPKGITINYEESLQDENAVSVNFSMSLYSVWYIHKPKGITMKYYESLPGGNAVLFGSIVTLNPKVPII